MKVYPTFALNSKPMYFWSRSTPLLASTACAACTSEVKLVLAVPLHPKGLLAPGVAAATGFTGATDPRAGTTTKALAGALGDFDNFMGVEFSAAF